MSRLKRILAAAAVLVAGGLYLGGDAISDALRDANQADVEPLDCPEWQDAMQRVERGRSVTFYVAVQAGYSLPTASASRVLGTCAAGKCMLGTELCGRYSYAFAVSPAVGGWKLARATANPYIAGGWKELASDNAEVKFWGAHKDIQPACLAALTPIQCRNLLGSLGDCWRKPSGDLCRYGRLYTTNRPGVDESCTPGVNDSWYPCTDEGHGKNWGELSRTEELPPDEELDL